MKAFVIANFASGKGKCASIAPAVRRILEEKSIEYTFFETVNKEVDIAEIRKNINSHDFVICMGGDGTVNEVVNAHAQENSTVPVGYIPCGSTNDFASNYGLSSVPDKAMEKILSLNVRDVDIGCLNGMYFCYVAAAGAFSETSYATSREQKHVLGKAAYILEGAKSLPKIKPVSLCVEADGKHYDGLYLISTYSNSSRIGGVFKFGKGMVDYSDGKMELALIKDPQNPVEFAVLLGDLVKGNYENKNIEIIRTDEVKITSEIPVAWSLDGEYGGAYTKTEIRTFARKLPLIC